MDYRAGAVLTAGPGCLAWLLGQAARGAGSAEHRMGLCPSAVHTKSWWGVRGGDRSRSGIGRLAGGVDGGPRANPTGPCRLHRPPLGLWAAGRWRIVRRSKMESTLAASVQPERWPPPAVRAAAAPEAPAHSAARPRPQRVPIGSPRRLGAGRGSRTGRDWVSESNYRSYEPCCAGASSWGPAGGGKEEPVWTARLVGLPVEQLVLLDIGMRSAGHWSRYDAVCSECNTRGTRSLSHRLCV